jgi:translation initiation factor 2 gamma subunit (eIF-2gamma)
LQYSVQQGQIDLSDVSQVDALEEKEKIKKRFCFKIVTPARVFIIDAETDDNMKSWIQAIKTTKDKPKDKKKPKKAGDPVNFHFYVLSNVF